jgi:hypothetical protein
MNEKRVMDAFHAMGWGIEIQERVTRDLWDGRRDRGTSRIDVKGKIGKQWFEATVAEGTEWVILDSNQKESGILIMLKDYEARYDRQNVSKMLVGHDERQLFVAAVPVNTKSVAEAKDRLKPAIVQNAERRAGVRAKDKNKHRNTAWARQGDFFFVPAPNADIDEKLIHRNEPINQRGGRSHIVQELYRVGGHSGYWDGSRWITIGQYMRLPAMDRLRWEARTRGARVYARGRITHPQHATLVLKGWHLVCPNTEAAARDRFGRPVWRNMAFID